MILILMVLLFSLPLPDHISENKVIEAIDPTKDVDGFHPVNVGKMVVGLALIRIRYSFWYYGVA